MGCMFRSEEMAYCEMYLQPEAAFEVLDKLGENGYAQMEDMTPELSAFQRNYITELCRCAELERIMIFIEQEMKKDKIPVAQLKKEPPALHPNELNEYEVMLEQWENDITQMSAYETKLGRNLLQLKEMFYTFTNVDPILGDVELRREHIMVTRGGGDPQLGGKLHVQTGVIRRNKCYNFEIMLWRISRGNIYFKTVDRDELFEDPLTNLMVRKVAFVAVCQGEELKSLMEKVCTGFHAHMFECPETYKERVDMLSKLTSRIDDLSQVIYKSNYHRCKQLRNIATKAEEWTLKVKKAKAIYYNMNLFSMDITKKCLIGQCWMPKSDLTAAQLIFENCSKNSGSKVKSFITVLESIETPPTYHRTNKFTHGFQALISAYGDSKYRELNPGLYTIITFPFLFAVMFGDLGHGMIMFLFALWMVLKEKQFLAQRSTNEIWNIFFGGRYIILLMSLFTLYTGFVYNDIFSKPMRWKDNYWINQYTAEQILTNEELAFDPARKTKSWYLLGVDPVWAMSTNKIRSENSMKMKMSIIVGVIHMMFGLSLSFVNHIHFKNYYAIFLQFIPQLAFLCCLFLWLVFMVFFKWYTYGPKEQSIVLQPGCAPFILILFIDMCLVRESKVEDESCEAYMFPNQRIIQIGLLVAALINVPILLFGSPIYLLAKNKKLLPKAKQDLKTYLETRTVCDPDVVDKMEKCLRERVHHYSESFGDLMIHQGVHTIEYVLSTISHTASYLRLWALSLAHAQLSEMLWQMIFSNLALQDHKVGVGAVKVYFVFAIWALFSLSILVLMEGLSAFLHTLRLHWVEFMSKFFEGAGKPFKPFTFKNLLHSENKDEKSMDGACHVKKKKNQL